jgi:hypothetical protein
MPLGIESMTWLVALCLIHLHHHVPQSYITCKQLLIKIEIVSTECAGSRFSVSVDVVLYK